MAPQHCFIENVCGTLTLHPCGHPCAIDGQPITRPTRLSQGKERRGSAGWIPIMLPWAKDIRGMLVLDSEVFLDSELFILTGPALVRSPYGLCVFLQAWAHSYSLAGGLPVGLSLVLLSSGVLGRGESTTRAKKETCSLPAPAEPPKALRQRASAGRGPTWMA